MPAGRAFRVDEIKKKKKTKKDESVHYFYSGT
jgi:hypothetical protein